MKRIVAGDRPGYCPPSEWMPTQNLFEQSRKTFVFVDVKFSGLIPASLQLLPDFAGRSWKMLTTRTKADIIGALHCKAIRPVQGAQTIKPAKWNPQVWEKTAKWSSH